MTQQHYHHHDYGVGRLLSRVFWYGLLLWAIWIAIVLIFAFPVIVLTSVAIVLAGGVVAAAILYKNGNLR